MKDQCGCCPDGRCGLRNNRQEAPQAGGCLPSEIQVGVAQVNGRNRYTFDGQVLSDGSQYLMGPGTYTFRNIPSSHPMAVLNLGQTRRIRYSGLNGSPQLGRVTNSTANGNYQFYSGDMTVEVAGDFGLISLYCLNHGSMGGEYALRYDPACRGGSAPQETPRQEQSNENPYGNTQRVEANQQNGASNTSSTRAPIPARAGVQPQIPQIGVPIFGFNQQYPPPFGNRY